MLAVTLTLSALTLAGLVLLVWFVSRYIRDVSSTAPADKHIARIGLAAAGVFVCLIAQKLIPLALVFLAAIALVFLFLVIYSRMNAKSVRPAGVQAAPAVTFRLVSLSKYERHIRDRHVLKRVVRLQGIVDSIRSLAGYDNKTLIEQGTDVLRMENIYLPRIENLLNQYLKVSRHDAGYDARKLIENLDTLTGGIRQIQTELLARDKIAIDVDADALITAMGMDGLSEEEAGKGPGIK